MKTKRKLNPLKQFLLALLIVFLTFILAFYILIICGASKKLQALWVCSAMTTMNHKYLATWFIPEDTINRILEENRVIDHNASSTMTDISIKKHALYKQTIFDMISTPKYYKAPPRNFKSYLVEGYKKLENGIYLKEISGASWKGYVMLISDPKRVKLCDTAYQNDKGQTVKRMVENSNAIAGLNGGGFKDGPNYDSNGGTPAGLIIENGILVNPKEPTDELFKMIGINDKGVLILRQCTAKWALENNIVSAVSFSPYLVVNGEGTKMNGSGGWGIAPRTAIGQRKSGEMLFVVIDGRQIGWSIGCDLDVLQKVLLDEKAENGAMLDGGSSTVLYYNNDYINRPSLGHERLINNCFIVTK